MAGEHSMGNPTLGTLELSDGLVMLRCSPSFLWSDCSRYLAVPQYQSRLGLFFSMRMAIIDCDAHTVWFSQRLRAWLQPESFSDGALLASRHFRQQGRYERWKVPTCFIGKPLHPYLPIRRDHS